MRALFLTALLATAAAAQDAPLTVPLFDADRCDAPATMPTPFEVAPGASIRDAELSGPPPVPMPNLCGETGRSETATRRPPVGLLYDRSRPLPEWYPRRFDGAAPRVSPEALRRFRGLLDREGDDRSEPLAAPDTPRD